MGRNRINIYLDDDSYEAYLKLKKKIEILKKTKKIKISISSLIARYIETLAESFDGLDILRAKNVVIELPKIEINVENVEFRETPKIRGPVRLTAVILHQMYVEWKRRFKLAMALGKTEKIRTLNKLRKDIVNELKKHKEAPEELIEEISKLLARIDVELDKYYNSISSYNYQYT